MIQDLHTHTYYSYCGKDAPDKVIKTAIENGIEFLGISDHCHGAMVNLHIITYNDEVRQGYVNQLALNRYYDHIKSVAYKYRDYITVWCGVEVATVEHGFGTVPNKNIDLSFFDYCFIENLDHPKSTVEDMFAFAKRTGCKICGIPHTDTKSMNM